MNKTDHVANADPVELLATWEGPAVNEPGVLFEQWQAEHRGIDADAAALAAWIGVTALSGAIGNSAYEAIKAKVLDVLAGWRRRFGQAKIDEVKQQLFVQVQQHRNNPRFTDEQLQRRIDLLFGEIKT